jgi:hypothetical protein
MPERTKVKGQTKCSPWCYRLGVERGANEPTSEKCTVINPRRRPRPKMECNASKEDMCMYGEWRING